MLEVMKKGGACTSAALALQLVVFHLENVWVHEVWFENRQTGF